MPTQSFAARFCRFEGPAHWQAMEGLGLVDHRTGGPGVSAVVSEGWLDEPETAAEYVVRQREAAAGQGVDLEVVEERQLSSPQLTDAHLAVYRSLGPGGVPLLQKQLTAAEGPLVCTLTVSGPEAEARRWGPDADAALASFEVPARGWAASGAEVAEPPSAAAGGELAPAPGLGLALPEPAGWSWDAGAGVLTGNGASLTVRRSGLPGGSVEECFAAALDRLGRSPGGVTGWAKGRTPAGRPWRAVETSVETTRTWGPPKQRLYREVYVDDEGVIGLVLEAEGDVDGARAAAATVVAGYRWLAPEERRLRLGEPWLEGELEGSWQWAGPGTYVRGGDRPVVVFAATAPRELPLARFADAQLAGLRASFGALDRLEDAPGSFKGCEAWRAALDGSDPDGAPVALRVSWLDRGKLRAGVAVRAAAGSDADAVLARLLDAIRPDAIGEEEA